MLEVWGSTGPSTLPQDYQGQNLCADLHICGNYLYASIVNMTCAWYLIDEGGGQLSYEAKFPSGERNRAVSRLLGGGFAANLLTDGRITSWF